MKAKVIRCERERKSSDNFLLVLYFENETFVAEPGQFIVLEPLNNRSISPRPFSVVDIDNNIVSILFNVVGENTKAYSQLNLGEEVVVYGPYGKTIPIKSQKYILVGGGIGGAALTLLAKKLTELNKLFTVLLGAREKEQLAGLSFFKRYTEFVKIITESDEERRGFVTHLLKEVIEKDNGESIVVACGPKPMLKGVLEICEDFGNECIVITEELMACSMGSCKGCAIFGKDGTVKHVCTDGPAFNAEWVDWDKFMPAESVKVIETPKENAELKTMMEVDLCGLKLEHPTMNGSGCLSIDTLEQGHFDYSKIGALVTKGVTLSDRPGNKMPRTCETPAGMINSIGLENVGIDMFLKDELPKWLKLGVPVIVNISGFSMEEYVELARYINDTDAVGVEVNVSCPNVKHGGSFFGTSSQYIYNIARMVCQVTNKIVIFKLTPNVTDIVSIAKAAVDGGANAISLINTVRAMAIDPLTRRPKIGAITGGLSGPAIRPIAVQMVHQLYQAKLGVPIIGMGGIEDGLSAAEFFIAGANLVAVGCGGFSDRRILCQIDHELREIIKHNGLTSINELVGSLMVN